MRDAETDKLTRAAQRFRAAVDARMNAIEQAELTRQRLGHLERAEADAYTEMCSARQELLEAAAPPPAAPPAITADDILACKAEADRAYEARGFKPGTFP